MVFAASAFAQAQPAAGGKIALINTFAFGDEKAGITKYKSAMSALDAEFKKDNDDLKAMQTKYNDLVTKIQAAQKTPATPSAVPAAAPSAAAVNAMVSEGQDLEISIKRKQEDLKRRVENRYQIVVGPIYNDIIKALNEFAKKNGYAVILDGAKLEESGLLMGFDDKYDITNEFVTFYNARPAGTASTTRPGN